MKQHIEFVQQLVAGGGPEPSEYETFTSWVHRVATEYRIGELDQRDLESLRHAFGAALSTRTVQGFALAKPHGYPGDFELMEKLYLRCTSQDPRLKKWDEHLHAQSAPKAVRNRKTFFKQLLTGLVASNDRREPLRVLNVASGPARDVFEFLSESDGRVVFNCVEWDPNAIAYARQLCAAYLDNVAFTQKNALRFRPQRRYQLVWSGGLFDYFEDRAFKFLLRRLITCLDETGELVIGNCSKQNPTRDQMEVLTDWHLHYRSPHRLVRLAQECGVDRGDIHISREPEGVFWFLHIKNGAEFIPFDLLTEAEG